MLIVRRLRVAFEDATTIGTRNLVYLLLGDWGRRFFSILFISIVARIVGPELFGAYGLAQDLALLFSPLIELGLHAFLIREAAREPDRVVEYAHGAIVLRLLVGILVFPICIVFAIWSGYSAIAYTLTLTQLSWIMLDTLGRSYRSALMSQDKMIYEGMLNTLSGGIRLVLAIVALGAGFGVIGVGVADIVSTTIVLGISTLIFYRVVQTKFRFVLNLQDIRSWIPALLPLVLGQLVMAAWMRVNTQILIQYDTESAVGILVAVNRLILMIIPLSTYQVVANMPKLSRYAKENKPAFAASASQQLKWVIYVGFIMSLLLCLGARPIVLVVFGSAYLDSIGLLQILAWQPFLYGICYSLVYTLIANDQQIASLFLSILPMGIYVALSLWLVPVYSYIGSGWATVIGFVVWSGFLIYYTIWRQLISWQKLKPSTGDWDRITKLVGRL